MGRYSSFSDNVRRAAVEEALSGADSHTAIARKYGISESGFRRWIKAYKDGRLKEAVVGTGYYQRKINNLEQMIGKQAVEIEFLKKLLNWNRLQLKKKEHLSKISYGLSNQNEEGAS